MDRQTRRAFLRSLGIATGAGSLSLIGCGTPNGGPGEPSGPDEPDEPGGPDTGPPPTSGIVVRGNVTSSGAGSLDSYRQAVEVMKGRPDSDPRSWTAQARIHLDHCPHGNAFFLPWHRAYLRYFEEVCREASGDPNFALPYWDWTTQRTIPGPFWQDPLNDSTRGAGPSTQMPAGAVGPQVIANILGTNDFETFGSAYVTAGCDPGQPDFQRKRCGTGGLEGTPHNTVHGVIGGNMATFLSPRDPIFWLHHCNVDRLWTEWNKSHANGSDAAWRSFAFANNFVDGQGNPVAQVEVQSTFDTTALGYRYDTQPAAGPEEAAPPAMASRVVAKSEASNAREARMGAALQIAIPLTAELRERLAPGPGPEAAPTTVRLAIGGIAKPADPVALNVFVGAAEAPSSSESPNFVRSVAFFPTSGEGSEHAAEHTFLFDVGGNLARLGDALDTSKPLSVHVQSVPLRDVGPEEVLRAVTPGYARLEVIEHS